ncbi:MAG: 30S ribosome-binding factor RbfA [Pseudarcicella sp.]|nr:30S ribosome-binding factor RbfA [Pseudarcicella sp.]MBP6409607.1 30S ribosome-binding factor RbfA [Pseudarcicella sp.]
MESKRQQQFSRQIQKDLSEIFQKEMRSAFGNAFITITDVKVSPDLSVAKCYLSFMMTNDKEGLLAEIEDKNKQIRNYLSIKIRKQVRIIPELEFFIDNTAEYAAKIDELFASIVIPPATED